jgi:hypothetical protein
LHALVDFIADQIVAHPFIDAFGTQFTHIIRINTVVGGLHYIVTYTIAVCLAISLQLTLEKIVKFFFASTTTSISAITNYIAVGLTAYQVFGIRLAFGLTSHTLIKIIVRPRIRVNASVGCIDRSVTVAHDAAAVSLHIALERRLDLIFALDAGGFHTFTKYLTVELTTDRVLRISLSCTKAIIACREVYRGLRAE